MKLESSHFKIGVVVVGAVMAMALTAAALAVSASETRGSSRSAPATAAAAGKPVVYVGTRALGSVRYAALMAQARAANTRERGGLTDKQLSADVLQQWIRQTALLEAAEGDDIVVSDSEVLSWLRWQDRERARVFTTNPRAAAAFRAAMSAQGDKTVAQYDADPKTIDAVREALMISDFVNKHVPATATIAQRQAFIDSVVAGAHVTYP